MASPDAVRLAADYAAAALAPATRRAYRSDFARFRDWCQGQGQGQGQGLSPLPAEAETIAAFLAAEAAAGRAASTLSRRLAAIAQAHRLAGLPDPTSAAPVRLTLSGIRRTHGAAPRPVAPLTVDHLRAVLDALPDDLAGRRDRALLLLGFAAALRRSELSALDWADLEWTDRGLLVHLRRSKTDPAALGQQVAVIEGKTHCPLAALRAWRGAEKWGGTGPISGPVFPRLRKGGRLGRTALSPGAIARLVKARAAAAGLDPALFSGHSLRAGFLTSAAEAGAELWKLLEVSRHRRVDSLKPYIRRADAFRAHAAEGLL